MKKGGVKRKDQANVMLGMSYFELKKFSSSKKAFKVASKDKRSRKTATSWITYVTSEAAREKQLRESLQGRSR